MSKPNSRSRNVTGEKFGHLTALEFVGYDDSGRQLWRFRCSCGNRVIRRLSYVIAETNRGQKIGCGCRQFAGNRRTHGKYGTPEYVAWKAMRQRCNDPNGVSYHNYGGRGVKVCPRWDDFANFLADMGPKPSPGHTVERRDNGGDYCPENCFWGTRAIQSRNKWDNILLTHNGKTQTVTDWATELGINKSTLFKRLERGVSTEKALDTSVQKQQSRLITHQGETLTAKEWSRRTGIPYPTIIWRHEHGWEPKNILRP